jgi:hypothetical protein
MSRYDKSDAAKDTNSSSRDVSRAWHDARDDAVDSGDLSRGGSTHSDSGDRGSDRGGSDSGSDKK